MMYPPQRWIRSRIDELENADFTPNDRPAADDQMAHAPGRFCKKCDRMIEAGQPARRRGETGWVHDMCPAIAD